MSRKKALPLTPPAFSQSSGAHREAGRSFEATDSVTVSDHWNTDLQSPKLGEQENSPHHHEGRVVDRVLAAQGPLHDITLLFQQCEDRHLEPRQSLLVSNAAVSLPDQDFFLYPSDPGLDYMTTPPDNVGLFFTPIFEDNTKNSKKPT